MLCSVILVGMFGADALRQTFHEPDSAMRLVQIRDFVAGQGWYDLTQYRLNPPDGVAMHWARWVDAVIAAPIVVLTPLLGRHAAEVAVAFAWPLGLLALFFFLMTRIAAEFGRDDRERSRLALAASVIAALAFPTIDRFAPGAFDHHNVVLVLIAAALWGLIRADRLPWNGGLAGLASGLAVATAAEALPFLIIGALAAGLLWVVRPDAFGRGLFWFGVGVGGVMLASFLALVPPSQWSAERCDAMSTNFLWVGLVTSAVAITLGRGVRGTLVGTYWRRLGCAAALGAVASGALLLLAPGCLGGGYGEVSLEMKTLWMAQISEARPLVQVWSDNLAMFLAIAGAATAGLVLAVRLLMQRPAFAPAWIVGGFLAGGVLLMVWQVRGAPFATAFAIPFCAYAVVRSREWYRAAPDIRRLAGFALVAVASTAAAWSAIGQQVQKLVTTPAAMAEYVASESDARACFDGRALGALDVEPAGVLLNQFAIGSGVLAASEHSVMAAPYHRNAAGTLAAIKAFRSTPELARELVVGSGATHVLVCDGLPEALYYAERPVEAGAGATLAEVLDAGLAPDWLEAVDLGESPLRLYRVRSSTGPELRGRF